MTNSLPVHPHVFWAPTTTFKITTNNFKICWKRGPRREAMGADPINNLGDITTNDNPITYTKTLWKRIAAISTRKQGNNHDKNYT
jgi:hypothetical protein